MNQILTICGDCYYCVNGQCSYAFPCGGSQKWSSEYNCFVPIGYKNWEIKGEPIQISVFEN